ncbi:MAG TPA: 23S rRNA (guanosine(2251)-2'-O)-methyltransferase RlmB, partial [Bacillota bacterium]|nr:23S rRNA (guanosine(2251)-2'-O)-methyltransferase RlmB [Bacillota bacterium]
LARDLKIPVVKEPNDVIDKMASTKNHQGALAEAFDLPKMSLEEVFELENPFVVVLDHLQDPHNLGAILRTAEAAGVDAVIVPEDRSVSIGPGAVKASAGAIEYVPIITVTNIARTVDQLKKANIWVVGTSDRADQLYTDVDLKGRLAVVIGSEGTGISRLVQEKCDFLVKIPMKGKISSLNASVAAGIILYEAVRQRR